MADRIVGIDEAQGIVEAVSEYVCNFSIGFVHFKGNEEDAVCAGSGTLVSVAGKHGILTADHVVAALPRQGSFGLVLPHRGSEPKVHRYAMDAAHTRSLCVGEASHDQNGPDLSLLVLGETDVTRLSTTKVFYNLDQRQERMLSSPRPVDKGGWFLAGMADEWTSDLAPEGKFTRVKSFRGCVGAGVVNAGRMGDEFDYLNFVAKYSDAYEGPDSYQGFSGGGLWQAVIEEKEGELAVRELLLSGVAFYQSAVVDGLRTIFCHGPRSIYAQTIAAVSAGR